MDVLARLVESDLEPQVWLMLAVGDQRGLQNHDGYDDDPSQTYEWTSAVNNGRSVREGDVILLRDTEALIGISVIDDITLEASTRQTYACPVCGSAKVAERKQRAPRYRCQACRSEFDQRVEATEPTTRYRSHHGPAWVDLAGALSRSELAELQLHRGDQNAIRPMVAERVIAELPAAIDLLARRSLSWHEERSADGHVTVFTRARIGQANFRNQLLQRFGSTCAFTGPAPFQALEAAHLYSYARHGRHESSGGLLLRRDVHRLFDDGVIAVRERRLDVAPEARDYPAYAALHRQAIQVPIDRGHDTWLDAHWTQHRPSPMTLVP
ncbi:HNH endonuclease signature motif containing protein [Agrococcus jejuensis]|uniref:HNH endonuclease n=1 Tax=Agrococcus jejuensis TaxID=399736 RepID=A0A1G8EAV5_9MICO|nr:HNH endonuclease signature motif containing protein [Agrococcus jejuensis]SDH67072.1 HNH endonuclease [Agrococcus jejuensis]